MHPLCHVGDGSHNKRMCVGTRTTRKNNYHAHAPIRCADAGISSTADGEVVLSSNDWFQ